MGWLAASPAILLALLLFLIPGALLAWGLGARRFALLALSPIFTISLISVASVGASALKIPWSVLPVLGLAIVAGACAFLLSRALRRKALVGGAAPAGFGEFKLPTRWSLWTPLIAAAVAFAVIMVQLLLSIGAAENISQTFDNIFHLNAVRGILNTGSASPFTVGEITGIPFYPDAWHATVALIAQLSGASIPVAVNASSFAIAALAWPLGCIYLCRQVFGATPMISWSAGILATGFGAFPLMMIDYGVLYPNLLSIALLPSVLALAIQFFGLSRSSMQPLTLRLVTLVLAIPGLALAHPSTLMALIAFAAPAGAYAFYLCWRRWLSAWPRSRNIALLSSAGVAVGLVVVFVLWRKLRPESELAFWPPVHSIPGALWGLLTNSERLRAPGILLSLLIVLGIAMLLRRRRHWWILGMIAVAWLLFIAVSAFPAGTLRNFLAGIWYNDSYRLAALIPAVAILPAVWGLRCLLQFLVAFLRKRRHQLVDRTPQLSRAGLAGLALPAAMVLALVLLQLGSISSAINLARSQYGYTADSDLLSSDELAVLDKVDELVPDGSVVAGNAANGSSLVYAFANRTPLQFHTLTSNLSQDDQIILSSLRDAEKNPAVCPAVRSLHLGYVLDFGDQYINNDGKPSPGLTGLSQSGVAQLLFQQGNAKLYKFTGCGLG